MDFPFASFEWPSIIQSLMEATQISVVWQIATASQSSVLDLLSQVPVGAFFWRPFAPTVSPTRLSPSSQTHLVLTSELCCCALRSTFTDGPTMSWSCSPRICGQSCSKGNFWRSSCHHLSVSCSGVWLFWCNWKPLFGLGTIAFDGHDLLFFVY